MAPAITAGFSMPPPPSFDPPRRRKNKSSSWTRRRRSVRQADRVCAYCRVGSAETVDHIVPVSRGGSNAWSNLVGCCRQCNELKADRTPKEAGMVLRLPSRFVRNERAVA